MGIFELTKYIQDMIVKDYRYHEYGYDG